MMYELTNAGRNPRLVYDARHRAIPVAVKACVPDLLLTDNQAIAIKRCELRGDGLRIKGLSPEAEEVLERAKLPPSKKGFKMVHGSADGGPVAVRDDIKDMIASAQTPAGLEIIEPPVEDEITKNGAEPAPVARDDKRDEIEALIAGAKDLALNDLRKRAQGLLGARMGPSVIRRPQVMSALKAYLEE